MENGYYYSTDNGFACAAAGRGITEALQEHLNIIVRNDELETEITGSQIQEEINALVEDKERLEQQKLDRQENLESLTNALAENDVELSQLQVALENPPNTDPPSDPHIEEWKKKIDGNNSILDDNISELETKEVERSKIEADLELPTQAELKPLRAEGNPHVQFTWLEKGFAGLTAFVLLGLVVYLFIFYASVGDRTFTSGVGTAAQKQHIIIPQAWSEAWEADPKNWFVLTFPFIFLTLAVIFYYFDEYSEKKRHKFIVLGATFLIDLIIAIKISQQIHEFKEGAEAKYLWTENYTEILSVLFLGFGVSLLLGYGLSWVIKVWKGVKPDQDESKRLHNLMRVEQKDRRIQLQALNTEIGHLEERNRKLKEENEGYKNRIKEAFEKPIEIQIAGLNTKREVLQKQITEFADQVESFQREINRCETEIESLLDRQRKKLVDIKKLEKQASEFVTGWCRYIAQRNARIPDDITQQIGNIQVLANQTLESYIESIKGT